jgi:hypothetical protein
MARSLSRFLLASACLIIVACAKKAPTSDVTVSILTPTEGSTVSGTAVHISLDATGIEIAPAADARPETAHHHLYLDVDFPQLDGAIPMGVAGVVHLGQAQKEYHWENVTPGSHRIIAVLADPGHIPLRPFVTDTVTFNVTAPGLPDTTARKPPTP